MFTRQCGHLFANLNVLHADTARVSFELLALALSDHFSLQPIDALFSRRSRALTLTLPYELLKVIVWHEPKLAKERRHRWVEVGERASACTKEVEVDVLSEERIRVDQSIALTKVSVLRDRIGVASLLKEWIVKSLVECLRHRHWLTLMIALTTLLLRLMRVPKEVAHVHAVLDKHIRLLNTLLWIVRPNSRKYNLAIRHCLHSLCRVCRVRVSIILTIALTIKRVSLLLCWLLLSSTMSRLRSL